MPFNLLIFPLVGGYYFLIYSRFTKYYHQRIERQKLLFNSILVGIVFLTISLVITSFLQRYLPETSKELKEILPFNQFYTGTAILSFILSIATARISNLFIKDTDAICSSITAIGNDLEKIIKDAFLTGTLISITLDTNKVYIGWPISVPKPSKSSYISILPLLSGYRDDKRNLVLTTEYLEIYSSLLKDGKKQGLNELGFLLVISTDEIISANLFDMNTYDLFNNK